MSPGKRKGGRSARKAPAAAAEPRRPSPESVDDGLRPLEAMLIDLGAPARRRPDWGPADVADPADRVAAMRGAISDLLARAGPGPARQLAGPRRMSE